MALEYILTLSRSSTGDRGHGGGGGGGGGDDDDDDDEVRQGEGQTTIVNNGERARRQEGIEGNSTGYPDQEGELAVDGGG